VACVLRDLGRFDEAREKYREALEALQATVGEDHPHTKLVRKNLEALKGKTS
jgi:hypothetical protein